MADSKLIDDLQKATGKTREECEQALTAVNGNYDDAVVSLGRTPIAISSRAILGITGLLNGDVKR